MKRLFTNVVICCWTLCSYGQAPDLLGTWYLDYMLFGDVQIHTMGGANPFIVFEGPSAPYQMTGNGGCNDFMGTLDYDSNNEIYVIDSFSASSNSCTSPIDQIENLFFNFFMITGQEYRYDVIIDSSGEEVLTLEYFPVGDTAEFRRNPPLSISEHQLSNIYIAPNPVKDVLYISSEMSNIQTLSVYDTRGSNVVDARKFNGILDVSALKKGVYFLELRYAQHRAIKKFVVD